MRYIFYCLTCGFTGSDELGNSPICPDCKIPLSRTRYTQDYWRSLDKYQKESIKANLADECAEMAREDRQRQLERKKQQEEALANYNERKNDFIITSTPNIEGYSITKYIGVVSAESSIGTGFLSELNAQAADFFGGSATSYESKLGQAKNNALALLKEKALQSGATALVGVDLDIINTNANIFIVCANGTAVVTDILR